MHRLRLLEYWFGVPETIVDVQGVGLRTNSTLPGVNAQVGWLVTRHPCGEITTVLDITWFAPGARKPRLAFNVSSPVHPFWTLVGTRRTAFWLPRQRQVWVCGPDRDKPQVVAFLSTPSNYVLKAQHFLACLRGEATPTCPPEHARRALALTLVLDRATRRSTTPRPVHAGCTL